MYSEELHQRMMIDLNHQNVHHRHRHSLMNDDQDSNNSWIIQLAYQPIKAIDQVQVVLVN